MPTRSFIGIHGEDDTIQAVYCHNDGYPTYSGLLLKEHYRDIRKITGLLKLGYLSVLGKQLGVAHPFLPEDKEPYDSYIATYGSMCVAYGRDRGDKTDAKTYDTERKFLNGAKAHGCEYAYLFRGGEWLVWNVATSYKLWRAATSIDRAIQIYKERNNDGI